MEGREREREMPTSSIFQDIAIIIFIIPSNLQRIEKSPCKKEKGEGKKRRLIPLLPFLYAEMRQREQGLPHPAGRPRRQVAGNRMETENVREVEIHPMIRKEITGSRKLGGDLGR